MAERFEQLNKFTLKFVYSFAWNIYLLPNCIHCIQNSLNYGILIQNFILQLNQLLKIIFNDRTMTKKTVQPDAELKSSRNSYKICPQKKPKQILLQKWCLQNSPKWVAFYKIYLCSNIAQSGHTDEELRFDDLFCFKMLTNISTLQMSSIFLFKIFSFLDVKIEHAA